MQQGVRVKVARVVRLQLAVKYSMDRSAAALILLVLAPLLIVIAAIIKLEDGGPILFYQERVGEQRRIFWMLKFRTMIPDADSFLDSQGRPVCDRLTRFGKFLRRWSLDELPQLVNVLRGDMSLVGPRPVPVEYAERMDTIQAGRFAVLPGITGLAQVRGRHSATWSQRIAWDLEYIENFSLMLDFKIAVLTIKTILDPNTLVDRGDPRKVDLG
jgi:lipopolysaccharide/colanic/teichoic acid biosynthesis glycosyltransferase